MLKYYRKMNLLKKVPANTALFIYVSTRCVETSIDTFRWSRGTASDWGEEVPGSIPESDKDFNV